LPGLKSKLSLTICNNSFSLLVEVPYENTAMDSGCAIPIEYDICTRQRLHRPALTSDLATQRAAYAAERSTLEKSLPEKAPPPWAPQPPYVSTCQKILENIIKRYYNDKIRDITIIFLPVRPASPCGPPIINLPLGFK
jgi:hypothetical protein